MTKSNTLYKDWNEEWLSRYRNAFRTINPNWIGPGQGSSNKLNSEGKPCFHWYNTQHAFSGEILIARESVDNDFDKAWELVLDYVKELESE